VVARLERHPRPLRATARKDVVPPVAFDEITGEGDGLSEGLYRALIVANFGVCVALGMLKNGCLLHGLQLLDKYDFREFLLQQNRWAADDAVVTALYDYTFGYRHGASDQPRVSACSAVEGRLFD
jgi:hypothetical protein